MKWQKESPFFIYLLYNSCIFEERTIKIKKENKNAKIRGNEQIRLLIEL